jgi:hypothetical protein
MMMENRKIAVKVVRNPLSSGGTFLSMVIEKW